MTANGTGQANDTVLSEWAKLSFTAAGYTRERELLGDSSLAVEMPSNEKKDHSVLTEQRHEPSVQRVLQFLREKLA